MCAGYVCLSVWSMCVVVCVCVTVGYVNVCRMCVCVSMGYGICAGGVRMYHVGYLSVCRSVCVSLCVSIAYV